MKIWNGSQILIKGKNHPHSDKFNYLQVFIVIFSFEHEDIIYLLEWMIVTLLHFYLLLSLSPLGPGITPDLRRQVNIILPYTNTNENKLV